MSGYINILLGLACIAIILRLRKNLFSEQSLKTLIAKPIKANNNTAKINSCSNPM